MTDHVYNFIVLIACVVSIILLGILAFAMDDIRNLKFPSHEQSSMYLALCVIMILILIFVGVYAIINLMTDKTVITKKDKEKKDVTDTIMNMPKISVKERRKSVMGGMNGVNGVNGVNGMGVPFADNVGGFPNVRVGTVTWDDDDDE